MTNQDQHEIRSRDAIAGHLVDLIENLGFDTEGDWNQWLEVRGEDFDNEMDEMFIPA